MEVRGCWQHIPRMKAVSNTHHRESLSWALRLACYSRNRSKGVWLLFPMEDKGLAERRGGPKGWVSDSLLRLGGHL